MIGCCTQVYVYPVCTITHTATTWVTVLVAFHRYLAVCRPHRLKRFGTLAYARSAFPKLWVATRRWVADPIQVGRRGFNIGLTQISIVCIRYISVTLRS